MTRYIFLATLVAVLMFLGGCASTETTNRENMGSFKENNEVSKMYAAHTIDPHYNYYYYGRELQPDSIMGIVKNYTVQSQFWHQVDLTEDQLKSWAVWGNRDSGDLCASRRYMGRYQGADIFDPDGNVIGNWYSKRDWGIFEFPGNNILKPHPPRNQDGWSHRSCT